MKKTGLLIIVLGMLIWGLAACGQQEDGAAPEVDDAAVADELGAEGLAVIAQFDATPIYYYGTEVMGTDNLNVPADLRTDEVLDHYVEDLEYSPKEYFFQASTGNAYVIKEGCWFLVNENFKNVTPDSTDPDYAFDMFEEAEGMRPYIMQYAVPQE